jgi:hypothetical protein
VIAYLALRAASMNDLLVRDSRYTVERWLRANVRTGQVVGLAGPVEFMVRGLGFPAYRLPERWDALDHLRPDYVVINTEYSRRAGEPATFDEFYRLLRVGFGGYELAFAYKAPPGLSMLTGSAVFTDGYENGRTNLDKVNPGIEVYVRRRAEPTE